VLEHPFLEAIGIIAGLKGRRWRSWREWPGRNMMSWLEANWLTIVLTVIAAIGSFLISKYYFHRSKREKLPCYEIVNMPVVSNTMPSIPNVSIHYSGHGESIPQLGYAAVTIWNDGAETIRKGDVPKNDPFVIVAKDGCVILHVFVATTVNPANNFSISRNREKNRVQISFDYMDKGEGISVGLLHTGMSAGQLSLEGSVIGAGKPVLKLYMPTLPVKPLSASLNESFPLLMVLAGGTIPEYIFLTWPRLPFSSAPIIGLLSAIWFAHFFVWNRKGNKKGFPIHQKMKES
jgi:hypothetical protein